jgi:hypothetical protein
VRGLVARTLEAGLITLDAGLAEAAERDGRLINL